MKIFERSITVLAAVLCLQATTAGATTFAVDFQGIATSRVGDFAAETATANQVTGSIFIDSDLPFVTSANPYSATTPGNIDRMVQAIARSLFPETLAASFTFGSLTRTISTDTALNPISRPFGSIDIRAVDDNPLGANDDFTVFLSDSGTKERFAFQLQAEELIGVDPSLGFSMALLQSIDLGATGIIRLGGYRSRTGSINFSVTSLNVRQVAPSTVDPGATAVPLPAGLPIFLTALGMLGLVRKARRV